MKTLTNHTTLYSEEMLSWSVTNGILAFAITSGNVLILVAFCKNQRLLHMRTNYFILSLCMADLIVGLVSMPLTICEQFAYSDKSVNLPRFIHPLSLTVDIVSGFASIFALAMITLERVFSVYFPHKYRTTPRRTYFSLIALVWFLSGLMASLRLLQFFKVLGMTAFFYAMFCLLLASLLIMLLGYLCVWRRVRQRTKYNFHHRLTTQERKFAITLLIITATFIVTWMPFHVINIIGYFSVKTLLRVPFAVIQSTKLLQFFNSLANPIIYTFRIRDFRRTLKTFICTKT